MDFFFGAVKVVMVKVVKVVWKTQKSATIII